MNNVSVLDVFLHDELIGTITHVGGDRTLFAFTENYLANDERRTLSLGFKDSFGNLISDFRPTQTKLIPFFSNLLPESTLRQYLAERAGVHPEREFFLLWVLGQDLPGAVTVRPADGDRLPPGVGAPMEQGVPSSPPLRFSLAGVQLKFSAVQEATGGLTIPATGTGGSWIVKLPSTTYSDVPENEYSMMELARKIGMDIPETRLVPLAQIEGLPQGISTRGEHAFAIRRFDRGPQGELIHMEDFAQVFRVYPRDKYKKASLRNIAQVVGIEGQREDIAELIRRLVFNTLIGNADMHLKNWSLIYRDGRNAALSPGYDFVSTIPYIPDDEAALKVSRSKKFRDFTLDELRHMAAKALLPEKLVVDTARETVALFHEVWGKEKRHLPVSEGVISAIERHLQVVRLL